LLEFNDYDLLEKEYSLRLFSKKFKTSLHTGTFLFEKVANRFIPYLALNGWSDQMYESIYQKGEYDDICDEFFEKHGDTFSNWPVELRLAMSIGGSALMYHFANKLMANTSPDLSELLKSKPHNP
jgi:hypothetical protein